MKKLFFVITFLILSQSAFAVNFGSYKTETDYGLIDGFKWNFFNREEGQPLVRLRTETEQEKIKYQKEKERIKQGQDEVQLYRFMIEDTVAF